jgi:Holliday junction DNA helicase RuvB
LRLLKIEVDGGGAQEIATRSRGTPRIANNLIHFVRDFAQERAQGQDHPTRRGGGARAARD